MSAFIVSGGTLLEVGCPSRLARATEQSVAFRTTLAGKRKAFVRRGGRRSWTIDVGAASPSEVSTIEAVTRNLGPVGWYGEEATAGNLISPQASGFDRVPPTASDAGLVQLPDGTVARSVLATGTVVVGESPDGRERVPVRPGVQVTVGAWSTGGQWFRGYWRDAVGSIITNWNDSAQTWSGWQWHEATLTPPAGVAYIELHLAGGTRYALPSVSWGDKAAAEIGSGCPAAVIHSPEHAPIALWPGTNLTDSNYTVTEVG